MPIKWLWIPLTPLNSLRKLLRRCRNGRNGRTRRFSLWRDAHDELQEVAHLDPDPKEITKMRSSAFFNGNWTVLNPIEPYWTRMNRSRFGTPFLSYTQSPQQEHVMLWTSKKPISISPRIELIYGRTSTRIDKTLQKRESAQQKPDLFIKYAAIQTNSVFFLWKWSTPKFQWFKLKCSPIKMAIDLEVPHWRHLFWPPEKEWKSCSEGRP